MATSYEKLYENLLPKFRSYKIPFMTSDEVKDFYTIILFQQLQDFMFAEKDLGDRDDILQRFNVDLSDTEIEILSNYLLLEYIDSNYVRVPTLLKVSLPSSDFKAFSSANLLEKLMNMHKTYLSENETLLSRYAWMGAKESGVSFGTGYKKNKL